MAPPILTSLAELLAAAEKRKYAEIRAKLGIPESSAIEPLQLDCLKHHLIERSGPVYLKLEGEVLQVGESRGGTHIAYRGEAIDVVLKAWSISKEDARAGIAITIQAGRRAA